MPFISSGTVLQNQGNTPLLQNLMLQPPSKPGQARFPSIVVYLQQLKVIEDYPAIQDDQINFFRMSLEHNLVKFLLLSKGVKLPYKPIPKLLGAFTFFRQKDKRQLDELSALCEQNDG